MAAMPFATAVRSPVLRAGLALLLLALAWDLGGQDLAVMRGWGNADGFALRHHPWLERWAHDGVRRLLVGVLLAWLVLLAWGAGPVRRWSGADRLAVGLGVLAALLVVNLIKRVSLSSCPWDLAEFGGSARYVSHWLWGVVDGGGAHCFPGGHASSALAFVGVALPGLAGRHGRVAHGVGSLLAVGMAGAVLGAVQTVRGAHYPSHTVWTLVICYAVSVGVWWAVHRTAAYQPSPMCSGK